MKILNCYKCKKKRIDRAYQERDVGWLCEDCYIKKIDQEYYDQNFRPIKPKTRLNV